MGKPIGIYSTASIMLSMIIVMLSPTMQPSSAYAALAQFIFHTSNIPITGESARIKVTDDTSGNLVVYRMFLLPGGLGNEVTRYARGDFNPGDSVTACKTDFNTDTDQCDSKTLDEVNAADFFFNR